MKKLFEIINVNYEHREKSNNEIKILIEKLASCNEDEFDGLLCKLIRQFKRREEKLAGTLLRYIARSNQYRLKVKHICEFDHDFSMKFRALNDFTDDDALHHLFAFLERHKNSNSENVSILNGEF